MHAGISAEDPYSSARRGDTPRAVSLKLLVFALISLMAVWIGLGAASQLTVTLSSDREMYQPGDNVSLNGQVLYSGVPQENVNVGIEVRNPAAEPLLTVLVTTDDVGNYAFSFALHSTVPEGSYAAFASVMYQQEIALANHTFVVVSPTPSPSPTGTPTTMSTTTTNPATTTPASPSPTHESPLFRLPTVFSASLCLVSIACRRVAGVRRLRR